jgi:hypothetical protein
MADAAELCPGCGMPVGATVLRDLRQVDEPLGFKRDSDAFIGILFTLILLVIGGVLWFLR